MIGIWGTEVKKTICSSFFWGMLLLVAGLCFCVPFSDEKGGEINCLSIFFQCTREQVLENPALWSDSIGQRVLSGYFIMFAPMMVSLSLLRILCEEQECGMLRYVIPRSGIAGREIGSFLAAECVGGLVLAMGYILFVMLVAVHSLYIGENTAEGMWNVLKNLLGVRLVGTFFYGMISALWTSFVAIWISNRYMIASIPYIVLWLLEREISKAESLGRFARVFWPDALLHPFESGVPFALLLGIYLLLGILIVVIRMVTRRRRVDCGT
jgi:hypothetical protein